MQLRCSVKTLLACQPSRKRGTRIVLHLMSTFSPHLLATPQVLQLLLKSYGMLTLPRPYLLAHNRVVNKMVLDERAAEGRVISQETAEAKVKVLAHT